MHLRPNPEICWAPVIPIDVSGSYGCLGTLISSFPIAKLPLFFLGLVQIQPHTKKSLYIPDCVCIIWKCPEISGSLKLDTHPFIIFFLLNQVILDIGDEEK